MKKTAISLGICISVICSGVFSPLFANEESECTIAKVDACIKARDIEHGGAGAKSITDYICPV